MDELIWKPDFFITDEGKRVEFRCLHLNIEDCPDVGDVTIEQFSRNTKFVFQTVIGIDEGIWEDTGHPDIRIVRRVWKRVPNEIANAKLDALIADFKRCIYEWQAEQNKNIPHW